MVKLDYNHIGDYLMLCTVSLPLYSLIPILLDSTIWGEWGPNPLPVERLPTPTANYASIPNHQYYSTATYVTTTYVPQT